MVLAGGAAQRLGGGDKPLLELAPGLTLLDELLRRLRPQAAPVALSANGDPARFARFGLPVLPDAAPAGPLAGVLAALAWAGVLGAEAVLTVPGDTPFIPPDLAARLVPAPARAGAHHAVACWAVEAAPALAAFLAGGGRRVSEFAARIGMRAVDFPDAPFFNVNTPADLAVARARMVQERDVLR